MHNVLIYPVGSTKACVYAAAFLRQAGYTLVDHPTPEITHLLLDVPSFDASGNLRDGRDLTELLTMLPENVTIAGGNLTSYQKDHPCLDLLKDDLYLAKNAAITAECALQVAYPHMDFTISGSQVLILGWGRIGKCLGQLLRSLGTSVTIAARKESDRAMIQALEFDAVSIEGIPSILPKCQLLFNSAPELLLTGKQLAPFSSCVKIDLASKPGIEGEDVIVARGLPGIYAPETSGRLIADRIIHSLKEGTP